MSTIHIMYPLILLEQVPIDHGGVQKANWFKTSIVLLGQFFFLIIAFFLIILAAYYVAKWIGTLQYQKLSNGNIKVIESVAIAPGKLLQLIKVGQQIFLIAVTKETIVYLKEIDSNSIEIKINEIKKQDIIPFEEQLKKWMGNKKKN